MTRFQVTFEQHGNYSVYVLRDLQTGATARVVPALGANCLELTLVPQAGAKPVTVINDMQYLPKVPEQASRYGIPILFPWPSGIPNGRFAFEGKIIEINPPGIKAATHHGFVNDRPWRVVRSDCDNTGAWLTCAIRSDEGGEKAERFSFPFELEVTWRLDGNGMIMQIQATNTGKSTMPVGLGLHPYFTIPFGPKGTPGKSRLSTAVRRQWDLDQITEVDPGETAPSHPFLPELAFDPTAPQGKAVEGVKFNHVYEAAFDNGMTHSDIVDVQNHLRLRVSADRDFGTWVIYTPPDRPAISLEPWTLVPNGFNLAAAGNQQSGLIALGSGKTWKGEVTFRLTTDID